MIFGMNTEFGKVTDLRDLRDGPDFVSSCLDVEAWQEEQAGTVGGGLPLLAVLGDGLPKNEELSTKN